MRAWLLVCAALAFAPGQPPTATAAHPPPPPRPRDEHIKEQILAKLGLSTRPTPLRAPPRDVVRKILQRAADPAPEPREQEHSMREIIAIAHRGSIPSYMLPQGMDKTEVASTMMELQKITQSRLRQKRAGRRWVPYKSRKYPDSL